ncbi:MAG: ABC transporter permease [Planctomycetales bacterium]|nr:ABC transporter permease [Planctomycetales bacterium]
MNRIERLNYLVGCAVANLARSRVRAGLTISGIAIATGALLTMISFVVGLQNQAERPFQSLGLLSQIRVTAPREKDAGKSTALTRDTLDQLRALPQVETAYPDLRLTNVVLRSGDYQTTARALGLPRELSLFGPLKTMLVAGDFFGNSEEFPIIVSLSCVNDLNIASPTEAVGQRLQVEVAGMQRDESGRFQWGKSTMDVTVVGVFDPPPFARDFVDSGVVMPVDRMADLPGSMFEAMVNQLRSGGEAEQAGFNQIIVRSRRVADVPDLEKKIQAMGFRTNSMVTDIQEIRRFFLFLQFLLGAVGTVAMVVGGLGILNTMLMSLLERKREIGIYKSMGASSTDIGVMFLTEAVAMGFLGGVGGLLLALVVSRILALAAHWYSLRQDVDMPSVEFQFSLGLITLALGYAVFITTLSGLYPAMRAARMHPLDALRG